MLRKDGSMPTLAFSIYRCGIKGWRVRISQIRMLRKSGGNCNEFYLIIWKQIWKSVLVIATFFPLYSSVQNLLLDLGIHWIKNWGIKTLKEINHWYTKVFSFKNGITGRCETEGKTVCIKAASGSKGEHRINGFTPGTFSHKHSKIKIGRGSKGGDYGSWVQMRDLAKDLQRAKIDKEKIKVKFKKD